MWPSNYNLPSPVVIWYTINIQVAREGIYKSVKAVCHGASSTMTLNRIDAAGLQRVRLRNMHASISMYIICEGNVNKLDKDRVVSKNLRPRCELQVGALS